VAAENELDPRVTSVDRALSAWRQGDCVLGEHWFAHRLDKSFAVTDAGRVAADADADLAEQQVLGLVVVTQTCDIVRSCAERPYVEVCPLVEIGEDRLREIERGRRPAYAFLSLLRDRKLVADPPTAWPVPRDPMLVITSLDGLSADPLLGWAEEAVRP
jgi:hypothetical protein